MCEYICVCVYMCDICVALWELSIKWIKNHKKMHGRFKNNVIKIIGFISFKKICIPILFIYPSG